MGQFLTAPVPSKKLPKGIPYILGNEIAERFSFYGMKAILFTFMTQYLLDASGNEAFMTDTQAREHVHDFVALAYFFPLIGAVISDAFWGKYKTILYISLFYCVGHALMALMDMPPSFLEATLAPKGFMLAGLFVVAMGAGGIKPCVSAHVGDQFGESNKHLLEPMFGWFYVSINLGATAAFALLPWTLEKFGPGVAFALPGILMGIATYAFWLGRNKFVHIPPAGLGYFKEAFTGEGLGIIFKLLPIFVLLSMFWALFDQTGAAWVGQAERMDRVFLGITIHEASIGGMNSFFILLFVPLFNYVVYPILGKFVRLTSLRKAGAGMFLMAGSFYLVTQIETWILAAEAAGTAVPNIGWQVLAYAILTASEVLVSITLLEFFYTQAKPEMKSLMVGIFYLAVSFGNFFTARVNSFTMDDQGNSTLEGADYYMFFTKLMLGAAGLFVIYSLFYKEKSYLQKEVSADTAG